MKNEKKHQSKNREARLQICHQVVKRLDEFTRFKGETMTELQKSLGLSPAYFAAPKRGDGIFGADVVIMILDHYRDLSPDWLLFGSGSKLRGGTAEEVRNRDVAYKKNRVEKEIEDLVKKTKKIKSGLHKLLETADDTLSELSKLN